MQQGAVGWRGQRVSPRPPGFSETLVFASLIAVVVLAPGPARAFYTCQQDYQPAYTNEIVNGALQDSSYFTPNPATATSQSGTFDFIGLRGTGAPGQLQLRVPNFPAYSGLEIRQHIYGFDLEGHGDGEDSEDLLTTSVPAASYSLVSSLSTRTSKEQCYPNPFPCDDDETDVCSGPAWILQNCSPGEREGVVAATLLVDASEQVAGKAFVMSWQSDTTDDAPSEGFGLSAIAICYKPHPNAIIPPGSSKEQEDDPLGLVLAVSGIVIALVGAAATVTRLRQLEPRRQRAGGGSTQGPRKASLEQRQHASRSQAAEMPTTVAGSLVQRRRELDAKDGAGAGTAASAATGSGVSPSVLPGDYRSRGSGGSRAGSSGKRKKHHRSRSHSGGDHHHHHHRHRSHSAGRSGRSSGGKRSGGDRRSRSMASSSGGKRDRRRSKAMTQESAVTGASNATASMVLDLAGLVSADDQRKAQEFIVRFLTRDSFLFLDALDSVTESLENNELATTLVQLYQSSQLHSKSKDNKAYFGEVELARWAIKGDIRRSGAKTGDMFRTAALSTKIVSGVIKATGTKFLSSTLSKVVREVASSNRSVEVDPSVEPSEEKRAKNAQRLESVTASFVDALVGHARGMSRQLLEVIQLLRYQVDKHHSDASDAWIKVISDMLFVRFLCPAIINPAANGLIKPDSTLTGEARRTLLLVSKLLQTIANQTPVADIGTKERFMAPLIPFIQKQQARILPWLQTITTSEDALDTSSIADSGASKDRVISLAHLYSVVDARTEELIDYLDSHNAPKPGDALLGELVRAFVKAGAVPRRQTRLMSRILMTTDDTANSNKRASRGSSGARHGKSKNAKRRTALSFLPPDFDYEREFVDSIDLQWEM